MATQGSEVHPGRILGPFEILELVGEGGMGSVYKARDTSLDRIVALKVAHRHEAGSVRLVREFLEEARAIAALEHPNIVPIYFAGEEAGVPFFAMHHIEGETLDRILVASPPSMEQALSWMLQLADALQFAHRHGILHHDLKPENIMIDGSGKPILLDFGLARILDRVPKTENGVIVVSFQFAAPESLLKHATDERSDIYSLGCVFFLLLTGHHPFESENLAGLVKAKIQGDAPDLSSMNPEVPREVAEIVNRMIRRRPVNRPRYMDEVVRVLSVFLPRDDGKITPDLTRITNRIKKIPPFPHVGLQLMKELDRESTNADRLHKIISADSVLAARILRVVNSAYYGIPNRVATIKHAVTLLGLKQIRDLAFGIYLRDLGQSFSGTSSPLQQRYWTHSVAVAFLSEAITRHLRLTAVVPGEAYMAGLLHDIGLLLLSRFEVQKTTLAMKNQSLNKMDPIRAEQEAIGTTHTELAEWLARKWELPENLQTVIKYHHTPNFESEIAELETVVRLADVLALRCGYGFYLSDYGWKLEPPLHRMLMASSSMVPEDGLLEYLQGQMGLTLRKLGDYLAIFSQKADPTPAKGPESSLRRSEVGRSVVPTRKPGIFTRFRRWVESLSL